MPQPKFETAKMLKDPKQKSVFSTSRFRNKQILRIVGYDFVEDVNKPETSRRQFPVLKTTLGGQPFDNIWLATLCRPVLSSTAEEIPLNGKLNQLALNLGDRADIETDEQWLKAIVEEVKDKDIHVVRERSYIRMFANGNVAPATVLEFDYD